MWSPRIQKAIEVAARAHRNQQRKGESTPYIAHLTGVAAILAEAGANEDTVIAGYLHDILEDVPEEYSRSQMKTDFGENVLAIVVGVTEDKDIASWHDRKQKYLDHLQDNSTEALLVSAADMANNIYTLNSMAKLMGNKMDHFFTSTPKERLWFYEQRMQILRQKLTDHPIMEILTEQWELGRRTLSDLNKISAE